MRRAVLFLTFLGAAGMSVLADDWERWRDGRRILLVRTLSRDDVRYGEQIAALSEKRKGLDERDVQVVVWEADGNPLEWPSGRKSVPAAAVGRRFPDLKPANWRVALIGRDGEVKAVWERVVAADEIFARIDAMPMGRLEKEERRREQR